MRTYIAPGNRLKSIYKQVEIEAFFMSMRSEPIVVGMF